MDRAASWTHNPTEGSVSGHLITQPNRLGWAHVMTVTAFIKDSSKRRWRIMAHAEMATQLLACEIGDRLKLTGIKGDLCPGAWDNAKRQIVPYSGQIMPCLDSTPWLGLLILNPWIDDDSNPFNA